MNNFDFTMTRINCLTCSTVNKVERNVKAITCSNCLNLIIIHRVNCAVCNKLIEENKDNYRYMLRHGCKLYFLYHTECESKILKMNFRCNPCINDKCQSKCSDESVCHNKASLMFKTYIKEGNIISLARFISCVEHMPHEKTLCKLITNKRECTDCNSVYCQNGTAVCVVCEKKSNLSCEKCFLPRYCSKECRKIDEENHKVSCKEFSEYIFSKTQVKLTGCECGKTLKIFKDDTYTSCQNCRKVKLLTTPICNICKSNIKMTKARVINYKSSNEFLIYHAKCETEVNKLKLECQAKNCGLSGTHLFKEVHERKFVLRSVYCYTHLTNLLKLPKECKDMCYFCEKIGNVQVCTNCKMARYCSSECQLKDWQRHKVECNSIKYTNDIHEKGIFQSEFLNSVD